MRDKVYLMSFLLGAGLLLYVGRDLLARSTLVTWGLTFGGTTAAAILGLTLYRVQLELRASRHELARKEAELSFALEVQRALFPRRFPPDSGLEFTAVCVPARGVSGDYYDVLELSDGRVVFAVADVSGKGISAAILMSNVHAVFHTLAEAGLSPSQVCSQLNRHLYHVTDDWRFVTFFYAEWNKGQRSLSYINAGHDVPILASPRGVQRLDRGGPALGFFLEAEFEVGRMELRSGDLLVVFSDGITEAGVRHGEMFGKSRLEAVVAAHAGKPLADVQQEILRTVREWAGDEVEDDMTLLLVKAV